MATFGRKIKVAVVGAGAAGLCAARHLSSEPNIFEFLVYEQEDQLGGTWCYTEKVGRNEYGLPIHSSMYENLRTNLPKEAMAFPDFPFKDNGKSFLHHTEICKYLEDYAVHYDLLKYIQFHFIVRNVKPVTPMFPDTKWIVEVENVVSGTHITDICDSVMVCNGHYSVPYIPEIDGLDTFDGFLMHSHDYRNNSIFRDMKVVVLGGGSSGLDISIEISNVAKEVVLSHHMEHTICSLPNSIIQEPSIVKICKNSVTFANQKTYVCDALVLCTGYLFSYPFLHQDCHVVVNDERVEPLFKHLFHREYPTLGIWGIPKQILPFPIYNQQCILFLKFLKGEVILPDAEEMRKDTEKDYSTRLKFGLKPRHAHLMLGDMLWDYDKQISELGNIPRVPNSVKDLFIYVRKIRNKNLLYYRENNFKIIDSESFIHLPD